MRRVYHPIYPRDNPKMYSNITTDYRWISYSFKEKFPHYSSFYTDLGWYPSDFNLVLFKAHVVFQGTNSGNFSTGGSEEQSVYFGLALSWSLDMPDHMHMFETAVRSLAGSCSCFPGKGQLKACPQVEEWMAVKVGLDHFVQQIWGIMAFLAARQGQMGNLHIILQFSQLLRGQTRKLLGSQPKILRH